MAITRSSDEEFMATKSRFGAVFARSSDRTAKIVVGVHPSITSLR